MIALSVFKELTQEHGGRLPLLTLDEFFNGNTEEDSIAPNQWGEGRPSLTELWETFQKVEIMPNVVWVRVVLHDDTAIENYDGKEVLNLSGDSIVICTTAQPTEIEKLANCERLCSDGVIEINGSELTVFSRIPAIPEGFRCLEIVWD